MATALDIPELFQAALKSLQMYSIAHIKTLGAIEDLGQALNQKLLSKPILTLAAGRGRLIMNGIPAEKRAGIEIFAQGMEERGIYSIAIHRGVSAREIKELILLLDENPERVSTLGGPEAFFHGRQHSCIRINETDIGFLVRHPELEETRPGAVTESMVGLPILPFDSHDYTLPGTQKLPIVETQPGNSIPSLLDEHIREAMDEPFLERSEHNCHKLLDEMVEGGFFKQLHGACIQIIEGMKRGDSVRRKKAKDILMNFVISSDHKELPFQIFRLLVNGLIANLPERRGETEEEVTTQTALATVLGKMVAVGNLDGFNNTLHDIPSRIPEWGDELRYELLRSEPVYTPTIKLFFKEGQTVLHSHVLPFFRAMGEPGSRFLLTLLEKEPNRNHRHRILQLLKELAPDSLPAIRESLSLEPWYFARNILNLLGELEDAVSADAMEWCFTHSDLRVRRAAIRAYWRTRKGLAENTLIRLLQESDQETQVEVLSGLGQIKAKKALAVVSALATTAPEALRVRALECLGEIGDPAAIVTFALCLKRKARIFKTTTEPLAVRISAARALSKIGTHEAYEVLRQAVVDEPAGHDKDSLQKVLSLFNL